jgi:hypothetical protein
MVVRIFLGWRLRWDGTYYNILIYDVGIDTLSPMRYQHIYVLICDIGMDKSWLGLLGLYTMSSRSTTKPGRAELDSKL